MKAVIYVLRGGLKHYLPPKEDEQAFYWDPKKKVLYPTDKTLEMCDEFELVEANMATERGMFEALRELKIPAVATKIRGSAMTKLGERYIDVHEPRPDPDPEKVIIAFSGKPSSMKSFLSRGLGMAHGIPVVQIGKELQHIADVGAYGEKLDTIEQKNPYVIGEMLVPILNNLDDKVVIVDGVKSYETALFLSYATKRPMVLFHVEISEEMRKEFLKLRMDPDDAYGEEREAMFEKRIGNLKEATYGGVIDMERWQSLDYLTEIMDSLGFKTTRILDLPNPFGSKQPLLELYRRSVEKMIAKGTQIEKDLSGYVFHTNYPERLRDKGLRAEGVRSEIINLLASGFRMVDDLLDEHTTREGKEAFWRKEGITKAIYYGVLMTVKAYNIAEREGLAREFKDMFKRVVDGVFYELRVEDGVEKCETYADWLKAAQRETGFREFLAHLCGMPEKIPEFREWGIRAQIKDDLLGARKHGRDNTDFRLNRPLFNRAWIVGSMDGKMPTDEDIATFVRREGARMELLPIAGERMS